MTDIFNRDIALASLAKVSRNAGTNFKAGVALIVALGNEDDTKDTVIESYAAGLLDCKASHVATLRLRASPDAKVPNAHGQRSDAEHKAIRAAEVFWVRARDAAGFKPAQSDGRKNNAKKKTAPVAPNAGDAPNAGESKARPMTLEAVTPPVVTDAGDALAWLLQLSIKAKTFRNANAKLFDTFGENGMLIRDALAALTKAIDAAKLATKKVKTQSQVVAEAA